MAAVIPGRYTAAVEGEFVVFLLAMRFNKFWKVHKWLPVAMAMGPMLTALLKDQSKGLLGFRVLPVFTSSETLELLEAAPVLDQRDAAQADPHLPAWRRFNQLVGTGGDVGIWHETLSRRSRRLRVHLQQHASLRMASQSGRVPGNDFARKRWQRLMAIASAFDLSGAPIGD
jgi:hypothetical protein